MPRRARNTHLNNYILQKHLSRGGFGSVYKAVEVGSDNTVLRNDVAIKVMHTTPTQMGKTVLDIVTSKELYGMDFYHANLITYYSKGDNSSIDISEDFHEKILCGHNTDFSEHIVRSCKKHRSDLVDKFIWIAMPYTKEGSLHDISTIRFDSDNPYDINETIQIIKQILAGIGYLHSKEYVHRDIKPGNVLYFAQDKQWRVSDYGLLGKLENGLAQSRGGGTPGWMAPEQSGRPVDIRADIYSIGQVFYYLLTGHYHFDHPSDRAPLPAQLNPHVPEVLSNLVLRCIEVDPSNRYPSIPVLAEHLEAIEARELLKKAAWNRFVSNLRSLSDSANTVDDHGVVSPEFEADDSDGSEDEEDFDYDDSDDPEDEEDFDYDLSSEESDLWGPCSFYTAFLSEHGSTVRYKHSIGRKQFSIYIPKALMKIYGYGGGNSEFPFEIKVSYREVPSNTKGSRYSSEPTDPYWDYKYYDWHGDSLQYRLYVGSHYHRIYVPKVALEGREPETIRLELEV